MNEPEIIPVPVVLANAEALAGAVTGTRKRYRKAVMPRTIVLSAANPVLPLLGQDLSRLYALVEAFGNDVVLCESLSQANDPFNDVAGLPNPQGYLLKASAVAGGASSLFEGNTGTGPAGGTTVATTGVLPAGTYQVQAYTMLTGTVTFADAFNVQLKAGTAVIGTLPQQGSAEFVNPSGPYTVVIPAGGAAISVATIGAGSGTAAYYAQLTVTAAGGPNLSFAPRRIETTEQMWVTAQAFPAVVSLLVIGRGPEY
jgi:hypothetical protein